MADSGPSVLQAPHLDRGAPQEEPVVLLVCSSGGHLLQMTGLKEVLASQRLVWVTFDKSDAHTLLAGETVIYAHGPTNRNIPNLLRNLRLASRVIGTLRPVAVISTGAGLAVPFAWIARARSIPFIYIESVTRIDRLSLSGRLVAPAAANLYVQWPELAARIPRATYAGPMFEI